MGLKQRRMGFWEVSFHDAPSELNPAINASCDEILLEWAFEIMLNASECSCSFIGESLTLPCLIRGGRSKFVWEMTVASEICFNLWKFFKSYYGTKAKDNNLVYLIEANESLCKFYRKGWCYNPGIVLLKKNEISDTSVWWTLKKKHIKLPTDIQISSKLNEQEYT